MRPVLALLAVALLTPGCKKFPDLGGIKLEDYLPKVKFDRMKVNEVDFEGIQAAFVFDVENPYPVDLELASFRYDLALEGQDFLDGTSDEGIKLIAADTAKVRMPARIAFADVFALGESLKNKEDVGFGLKGAFAVDTPVGPVSVPFDEQGRIPLLKVPQIEPTAVRLGTVNLLQNRATVEIDLAITNKAAGSAYGMQGFEYGIDLGGKRIINGDIVDLTVPAGATETRTIPVNLNLLELGTAIANAVAQKKPVDVRLDAGLSVDTPLGVIPLNVDRTVNLRVQ